MQTANNLEKLEIAKATLVRCFANLKDGVNNKEIILSGWRLEELLDEVARALTSYLDVTKGTKFGCAILYRRLRVDRCYVGGASRDKRKIDFNSRYYNLTQGIGNSLTVFSMRENVCWVLDNFAQDYVQLRRFGINHKPKNCETSASNTASFYCFPVPRVKTQKIEKVSDPSTDMDILLANRPALRRRLIKQETPPLIDPNSTTQTGVIVDDAKDNFAYAAIRVTSSESNQATEIDKFLNEQMPGEIRSISIKEHLSDLLRTGVERIGDIDSAAIGLRTFADFVREFPNWRDSEYFALDQLTIFLQNMFESCEVSIFEAHEQNTTDNAVDVVLLYLAATTALCDEGQHRNFREAFYKKGITYKCVFKAGTNDPVEEWRNIDFGKTALAYYPRPSPYHEPDDMSSRIKDAEGNFIPGEIPRGETKSFLAFGIPPTQVGGRNYGVIRIVSGNLRSLRDRQRELAGAVGVAAMLLWESFPKNEKLRIGSLPATLLRDILRMTHATGEYEKIILMEFRWLLQKLFIGATSIEVLDAKLSDSNDQLTCAAKDDHGTSFECKVEWKPKSDRYKKLYESGWRETRNLKGIQTPLRTLNPGNYFTVRSL